MTGVGRRRRKAGPAVVAVAAVVVAGGAATAASGTGFGLRGHGGGNGAGSGLPPATAKVTRQTLVDTQTETGELGYGNATIVSGRLAGTVTALPASGATVKRGQALYRVDNTPVVLLYGSLPAYRALSTGTEGSDVEQFEQNLRAIGYTGFTVDDEYSSSTAAAVKEWQEDLGLPQTGTVDLGRVYYARGQLRVDTLKAALGDQTGPGTAVLTYTGTSRVVTVELDMNDQRLARKGAAVNLTLPDGKTVAAKIARVSTIIDSGDDDQNGGGQGDPTTKLQVIITINDAKVVAGLNDATIDVGFTASERKNVLTVPVAALLALAEGGYGIQVVEGTITRIAAVETGLFAAGRVEVSGDALSQGMTVGMPS
jgi:peptidoglycan hydrolase-like protein with peptidoglycan-binding domain